MQEDVAIATTTPTASVDPAPATATVKLLPHDGKVKVLSLLGKSDDEIVTAASAGSNDDNPLAAPHPNPKKVPGVGKLVSVDEVTGRTTVNGQRVTLKISKEDGTVTMSSRDGSVTLKSSGVVRASEVKEVCRQQKDGSAPLEVSFNSSPSNGDKELTTGILFHLTLSCDS